MSEAVVVVQLSDLHVRPKGRAYNRIVETNALVERAFRAVARLAPRPDAVVITGDLTECGLPEEYETLRALLGRWLPEGVHVVPGNHDRRDDLVSAFGLAPAPTGFVDRVVDLGPIRLVLLDTLVPGAGHGALRAEQLDWLDAALASRDAPTMVAMHHPPFLCGIGHMDAITLRAPGAFAATLERHPHVERVVCGHVHRQVVARVGRATASIAPAVGVAVTFDLAPDAPSTFVMEPPAFVVHRWTAESGFVSHTVPVEDFDGPYPFVNDPDYPGASR